MDQEFTHHVDGSPCPAPTEDNLLVLYFDGREHVDRIAGRLEALGGHPVGAENPYWPRNGGVTFEGPDGWRVVFMPAPVF